MILRNIALSSIFCQSFVWSVYIKWETFGPRKCYKRKRWEYRKIQDSRKSILDQPLQVSFYWQEAGNKVTGVGWVHSHVFINLPCELFYFWRGHPCIKCGTRSSKPIVAYQAVKTLHLWIHHHIHWSINGKYIIIPPPTPLPRVLHISLHARLKGLFICGEPALLARLAKFMPRFPFKLLFCLWEGGLACLLRSWLGSSNWDWQQVGQAGAP